LKPGDAILRVEIGGEGPRVADKSAPFGVGLGEEGIAIEPDRIALKQGV
jgi:hypothetical protein